MVFALAFVFAFGLRSYVWSLEGDNDDRPQIRATHTASPPYIDGLLNDAVWHHAAPVVLSSQREPIEGAAATERTEVRVLYDDEQLYIAFRCHDTEPDRIVANLMRRDAELDENDYVMLVLDTYRDGRGGFFFATNPLGARRDILLSNEGRSRNEAWDCIWSCRANRDETGWNAEMAIPFSQLRYPASEEAVWGINVGRIIRRKREEVFLLPPPRAYGIWGRYRTSRLADLVGLGMLKAQTLIELSPFILTGNQRNFEAVESSDRFELDPGFDLKYGLTPGLMLDLSYRTDFAQVESDQEQVNLTRFSLFFPERRSFFLEGAGIFDFGERIERRGSGFRPPTLLFYSRRIGLQEGENIPVIAGSKITGRLGRIELGLLNMWTERETVLNEAEVDLFRTDEGALLEQDDPGLDEVIVVDTVEVDRIDTVRVARTNFSVLRLRHDILDKSNIGLIVTSRDPGEASDFNRSIGADFNLSLLETSLKLRGFLARTWTPDADGNQFAHHLEVEHQTTDTQTRLSYLDVEENFNPEIGFVPRNDIRQFRVTARYRPWPQTDWIRRFSLGPRVVYLMNRANELQTRNAEYSAFVNLEIGDWIGVRVRNRFERLDEPFEIHKKIEIPEGDYEFTSYSLSILANEGRRLSGRATYEIGEFFSGSRNRLSLRSAWKHDGRLTFENDYERNRVFLPQGDFTTNRLGQRFILSLTPDFFVRGFVQWNSKSELVGGNFLLNYRYRAGSDLYLVYNQVWDTEGDFRRAHRSLQLKFTYFWQR